MKHWPLFLILVVILGFSLLKPGLPLSVPLFDPHAGISEWTKEGKAKIRGDRAEAVKIHNQLNECSPDKCAPGGMEQCLKGNGCVTEPIILTKPRPTWLVVITQCGVGVNSMAHSGWWPYSSTRSFKTKDEAKKFMDQMCEPHGCQLLFGTEES